MKTHTFSTKSLHYRVANKYGDYRPFSDRDNETDICSYTKQFISGLVLIMVIIGFCGGYGGLMLSALLYFLVWLYRGYQPGLMPEIVTMTFFGTIAIGAILGIALIIASIADRIRRQNERARYLGLATKSWWNKVCFKMKFED